MLTRVYETLRSAGRELVLEVTERPGLEARIDELREAARAALDETTGVGKADTARASVARALELLERPPASERLLDLSDVSARGGPRELFAGYEEARTAVEQAALDELAARDRALLEELLRRFADAYAAAKASESALDFEDLQLVGARPPARRAGDPRARELALPLGPRRRVPGHEPAAVRARSTCSPRKTCSSSATSSSRSTGFRHADVEVFRERREASGGVLALTENYRSRPEVLEVINHLFSSDFGDAFRPLSAAGRFEDPAFGPAVELLVTDKASYKDTGVHWRAAEAKHVARA